MAMRGLRCAFNATAALYRTFMTPVEHTRVPTRCPFLAPGAPTKILYPASARKISNTSLPTAKKRLPRDDEIKDRMIRLASEDGKLSPPQYTKSILNSIDRLRESLVMVAVADSDPDEESDTSSYAICKIQPKQVLREVEKARQKKKEVPSATVKVMELNWAIDPHDLQHRLQRVKDFLEKGWKVDVVMAGKRRGRKATPEETRLLVGKVREAWKQVDGAKEWRDMEGIMGATATMFLVGRPTEKE